MTSRGLKVAGEEPRDARETRKDPQPHRRGRATQGTGTRADPLIADTPEEVAELRQRYPKGAYVLYKGQETRLK